MAQVMGRLTNDANVKTLDNGKQLVEFSVAENFRYKPKNGDAKEFVTFYNCVIWNRTNIAPHLKKGTAVIITGQLTADPYKDKNKKLKASLKFTVNKLEFPPSTIRTITAKQEEGDNEAVPVDDLPF